MGELALLVFAGVGAGVCGSVAGLASLVSYPALLAYGLPPLSANVTNTTAMLAQAVGSGLGSRRELRGQGGRVLRLMGESGAGGLLGAALLLLTPDEAFETVVPWLVAFGAIVLLARDRVRHWADARRRRGRAQRGAWPAVVVAVGTYGGYFGAGVGIIMLAVLSVQRTEPLAVTNAVKNVSSGTVNAVAAVTYAFLAPIDWAAVLALGAGALAGGALGPQIVRLVPERPLRYAIAAAGFVLAGYLWA